MPSEHFIHLFHHVADNVLFCASRWAVDSEVFVPATSPPTKYIGVGYRRNMIPVQMRDKDVIELIERNAGAKIVCYRTGPHIKNKVLTVAKLYVNGRSHLTGTG